MALLERLWRGWRITPLLTFVIGRAVALSLTLVTAFDIVRQRQVIRKNLEETGRLVAESWGSVFADSFADEPTFTKVDIQVRVSGSRGRGN